MIPTCREAQQGSCDSPRVTEEDTEAQRGRLAGHRAGGQAEGSAPARCLPPRSLCLLVPQPLQPLIRTHQTGHRWGATQTLLSELLGLNRETRRPGKRPVTLAGAQKMQNSRKSRSSALPAAILDL